MGLGKELRNARLKKKLTASEVAAATRMKVQIVEDIEREDFSRIAAPIYGKGFIKLYAEHVGLDPKPLVDEYTSRFVGSKPHYTTSRTQFQIEEKMRLRADTTAVSDAGGSAKVRATRRTKEADTTRRDEPDLFSIADLSATAPISKSPRTKMEEKRDRVEREGEKFEGSEKPVRPASAGLPGQSYGDQEASIPSGRTAMEKESGDGAKKGFSDVRLVIERAAKKTIGLLKQLVEKLREKVKAVPGSLKKHEVNLREFFFGASPLRSVSVILGILIVLVFVISCLYRCVRRLESETVLPLPETKEQLRLTEEPPPPYFE